METRAPTNELNYLQSHVFMAQLDCKYSVTSSPFGRPSGHVYNSFHVAVWVGYRTVYPRDRANLFDMSSKVAAAVAAFNIVLHTFKMFPTYDCELPPRYVRHMSISWETLLPTIESGFATS